MSHVHYWVIEYGGHAVCKYCHAEKNFDRVADPLGRDKLKAEDRKIIAATTVERRRETIKNKKKEVKKLLETQTSSVAQLEALSKPIVTITPPLNTMPAKTQKAITEMAGKAAEQLVKVKGKRGPYVKKVKKSGIAPNPEKPEDKTGTGRPPEKPPVKQPDSATLAAAHWAWLESLIKEIPRSALDNALPYALLGKIAQEEFTHGFKHGFAACQNQKGM